MRLVFCNNKSNYSKMYLQYLTLSSKVCLCAVYRHSDVLIKYPWVSSTSSGSLTMEDAMSAVEVLQSTCSSLLILAITSFLYSLPISIHIFFIGPYISIESSKLWLFVPASWVWTANIAMNLVSQVGGRTGWLLHTCCLLSFS